MTLRTLSLSIIFAVFGVTSISRAVVNDTQDLVARFEGTTQASAGGQQVSLVVVKLPTGTSMAKIAIPNTPPAKAGDKALPKAELVEAVKKLTVGSMAKLTVTTTKEYGPTLVSIEAFTTQPGEETPNGYVLYKVFEKETGKTTIRTIVLTKFGVEHSFGIVMRRGEKGAQEEDPDVVAAVKGLQEGSSVWIQAQGSKLTAIEAYTEPQSGKLLKLGDTEIDSHKVRSAEIEKSDGKTVTVLVPGKVNGKAWVADSAVNAALGKVRPNTQVDFRVHEDGDKLWLRDISATPKSTEKKPPAEKEMPKKKE